MKRSQCSSGQFDELVAYLRAARQFPPLARDEEHSLALRARKGDLSAKQKLVQHSLAFVVSIAFKQRCIAPGFLDTRLRYAATRSVKCSRARDGLTKPSFSTSHSAL
jgi:hypothetical protein